MFSNFFNNLGPHFISGVDYNSEHILWSSRLINTRGRLLHTLLIKNRFNFLSPPTLTYWPTNPNRLPIFLDIFVCRGVAHIYTQISSLLDFLSSGHSPILLNLGITPNTNYGRATLSSDEIDWDKFRDLKHSNLSLNVPLKLKSIQKML